MKVLFNVCVVLAFCACAAGCAGPGASLGTATLRLAGTKGISTQDVRDAIAIGKSTKGDVIAALGKTTAIHFDSGFEVWVYRYADEAASGKATPATAEFVVLFAPTGIVTKTRIRPVLPAADGKGT